MTGTRECVLECYTCIKDHDPNNPRCRLASLEKVQEARTELYLEALVSSGKEGSVFNTEWEEVKPLLRLKFDNSGTMVGFYS